MEGLGLRVWFLGGPAPYPLNPKPYPTNRVSLGAEDKPSSALRLAVQRVHP